MDNRASDTRIAVLQAAALHVVLFALMFAGLKWSMPAPEDAPRGEPIAAELVDIGQLSAPMQRALKRAPLEEAPVPAPTPEPTPEPPRPPDPQPQALPPPVPDPAPVEQEKVQRDAPLPPPEKPVREQEQKQKKPDQAELDAQKRIEAERKREQELAEIRKLREQAARERTMAEQRAQQLADARGSAPTPTRPAPGDPSSQSRKNAAYQVALMNAILRQWTRPDSVQLGQVCQVMIRQIPGGEVVSVQVSPSCPYDDQGRRSVEAAILKASPLPYAGFEDVFVRDPVLKFRAEDL